MNRGTIFVISEKPGKEIKDCLEHIETTVGEAVDIRVVSNYKEINDQISQIAVDHFAVMSERIAIHQKMWLKALRLVLEENRGVAAVGVKTVDLRGLIISCGRNVVSYLGMREIFANIGYGEADGAHYASQREVDSVFGSLLLINKKAFQEVGGFDRGFEKLQRSCKSQPNLVLDDFCLSARELGYEIWVEPEVLVSSDIADTWEVLSKPELCNQLDDRVVNMWQKKWHWHPDFPDLEQIRNTWPTGKVCWRIGKNLEDEWKADEPLVDILIVTRNNKAMLERTIDCLAQTDYPNFKVFILFNGAGDDSPEMLWEKRKQLPFEVNTLTTKVNIGLPAAMNWLVAETSSPLVARLDDDIQMGSDWLKRLVEDLRQNRYAGAVGCKIVCEDDERKLLWADYRLWPRPNTHQLEPDDGQFEHLVPTIANMGCCMLYRRKALEKAGPIDIAFSPISWEDLEYQLTLRRVGYDVLFDGRVKVKHPWKAFRDSCKSSRCNVLGNGTKVHIKWGPGIFEVIDRGIDLRLGRVPESQPDNEVA
ncbi:MAG: glycosyltransferase [Verrucomicrobiota bacterium]